MKYKLRQLPQMMMTPVGRQLLAGGFRYRAYPYYRSRATRHRLKVIPDTTLVAVVGSLGKTTTCRMANAALGLPPKLEPHGNANSSLARLILSIRAGEPSRVVEVGIRQPGQMELMAGMVRPDITVVTSISTEHIKQLKSLKTTRHEKAFMVRAMDKNGVAVLNADDENVMWMASQTEARIFTFGFSESADLRIIDFENDFPRGTKFRLHHAGQSYDCRINLLGWPAVLSATGGVAAGLAAGHTVEEMIPRVAALAPTQCRLEPLELANGATLINDTYKNGIESIHSALETLEQCKAQRRIAVLGVFSDYTNDGVNRYLDLTRVAYRVCDVIYVYSDMLPKYQDAARQLGLPLDKLVQAETDFSVLSDRLLAETGPGDVILPKVEHGKIERLCLKLQGKTVNCTIPKCWYFKMCHHCPMVERGWGHSNAVDWML